MMGMSSPCCFGAVAVGHHAIQYDEIRAVALNPRFQILRVGRKQRIVLVAVQIVGQKLTQGRVVIHDQDFHMRFFHDEKVYSGRRTGP
jgi:hypothetical protein